MGQLGGMSGDRVCHFAARTEDCRSLPSRLQAFKCPSDWAHDDPVTLRRKWAHCARHRCHILRGGGGDLLGLGQQSRVVSTGWLLAHFTDANTGLGRSRFSWSLRMAHHNPAMWFDTRRPGMASRVTTNRGGVSGLAMQGWAGWLGAPGPVGCCWVPHSTSSGQARGGDPQGGRPYAGMEVGTHKGHPYRGPADHERVRAFTDRVIGPLTAGRG